MLLRCGLDIIVPPFASRPLFAYFPNFAHYFVQSPFERRQNPELKMVHPRLAVHQEYQLERNRRDSKFAHSQSQRAFGHYRYHKACNHQREKDYIENLRIESRDTSGLPNYCADTFFLLFKFLQLPAEIFNFLFEPPRFPAFSLFFLHDTTSLNLGSFLFRLNIRTHRVRSSNLK